MDIWVIISHEWYKKHNGFAINHFVFSLRELELTPQVGASTVRTDEPRSPEFVVEAPPRTQCLKLRTSRLNVYYDEAKMSDRRREERLEVCLDAVWDGKSGNYDARVTDLSEGGCYVDTLGEAHVGEILSFKLQLPGGEWLELTGEVAHQTSTDGLWSPIRRSHRRTDRKTPHRHFSSQTSYRPSNCSPELTLRQCTVSVFSGAAPVEFVSQMQTVIDLAGHAPIMLRTHVSRRNCSCPASSPYKNI